MPTFTDEFEHIEAALAEAPAFVHPLLGKIKKFEDSIDGVKSAKVSGFPGKYVINVDFTNVKPVKLFGKMIDEAILNPEEPETEEPEAEEPEADEPEAEEPEAEEPEAEEPATEE